MALQSYWESSLNPPISHDSVVDGDDENEVVSFKREKRECRQIPVSYRACRGHSCFVRNIERMYAPYELGMARCHGSLLHTASIDAINDERQDWGSFGFMVRTMGCAKNLIADFFHSDETCFTGRTE
eukprot:6358633-Pyramimonas_sp.AAC.1